MVRIYTRSGPLGYLGQAGTEFAQAEFVRSWKRLQAETDYLANARPSDWEFRATQAGKIAAAEINFLKGAVLGKTGNPEGEDKLFSAWGDILAKSTQMLQNKPSLWEQIKDKTSLFFTDFWQGVREAQQSYAEWIAKNAGSILSKYHESVNRSIVLETDLNRLVRERQISDQTAQTRRAQIAQSKALLDAVRSAYKAASGGASIDELAQKEYGSYQALSAAPVVIGIAAVVAVVAISALVVKAWSFINGLEPLTAEAKAAVTQIREAAKKSETALMQVQEGAGTILKILPWAIGGIAVAVVAYFLFKKK